MTAAASVKTTRFAALACVALAFGACGKKEASPPADATSVAPGAADSRAPDAAPSTDHWTSISGEFIGPAGEAMGTVTLSDALGGVLVRIEASGLAPGWHGAHLHMVADCADGAAGFKASGGHVDPEDHDHGIVNPAGSERGDLPNLFAHTDGNATAEFFRTGVHLMPSEESAALNGPYPLLDDDGFAVIIHANADDHSSQPIGGAGDRVACAAIKE